MCLAQLPVGAGLPANETTRSIGSAAFAGKPAPTGYCASPATSAAAPGRHRLDPVQPGPARGQGREPDGDTEGGFGLSSTAFVPGPITCRSWLAVGAGLPAKLLAFSRTPSPASRLLQIHQPGTIGMPPHCCSSSTSTAAIAEYSTAPPTGHCPALKPKPKQPNKSIYFN